MLGSPWPLAQPRGSRCCSPITPRPPARPRCRTPSSGRAPAPSCRYRGSPPPAAPRCALLKTALRNLRPPLRSAAAGPGPAGGPALPPSGSPSGCLSRSEGLQGRPVPATRPQLGTALAFARYRGASKLSLSRRGLSAGPAALLRIWPQAIAHCSWLTRHSATWRKTGPGESTITFLASGHRSCLGSQLCCPQALAASATCGTWLKKQVFRPVSLQYFWDLSECQTMPVAVQTMTTGTPVPRFSAVRASALHQGCGPGRDQVLEPG